MNKILCNNCKTDITHIESDICPSCKNKLTLSERLQIAETYFYLHYKYNDKALHEMSAESCMHYKKLIRDAIDELNKLQQNNTQQASIITAIDGYLDNRKILINALINVNITYEHAQRKFKLLQEEINDIDSIIRGMINMVK